MLYLVSTPIGNLKDITFRAIEILKSVDYILCEDTRNSLKLLKNYDINKPLVAYHKFSEKEKLEKIIGDLKHECNIALISDAGMPVISDPGQILVNRCIEEQLQYSCLPGASAFSTAFVLSGFDLPFTFYGFFPDKIGELKNLLNSIKNKKETSIFYLSVHDVEKLFKIMYEILGNRKVCICRELTKKFEQISIMNLEEEKNFNIKGEFVLLINKSTETKFDEPIEMAVDKLVTEGLSKNDAIKIVAKERYLKKSDVYSIVLKTKK